MKVARRGAVGAKNLKPKQSHAYNGETTVVLRGRGGEVPAIIYL